MSTWTVKDSLRKFADELNSPPAADEVLIALIQAAEFNGGGLETALKGIAENLHVASKNMLEVDVERAKARDTMRIMAVFIGATVVYLVFFGGSGQLDFYRTPARRDRDAHRPQRIRRPDDLGQGDHPGAPRTAHPHPEHQRRAGIMTVTWLTILPGLLFGIALGMIVLAYAPQTVRTSDALARLGEASVSTAGPAMKLTRWDRVGSWLAQHLPAIKFLAPPTKDLDLLEMSVSYFYASKAKAALFGFAAPLVLPIFWQLVTGQPSAMLLAPSPIFAIVLWFSVDTNVKARAAKARQEVTRFMGVYLQTVAVALLGNTTPRHRAQRDR